jgi:hypothetical protein
MPDTQQDADADGYYDDDMGQEEQLDLSFLDQDDEQPPKK